MDVGTVLIKLKADSMQSVEAWQVVLNAQVDLLVDLENSGE